MLIPRRALVASGPFGDGAAGGARDRADRPRPAGGRAAGARICVRCRPTATTRNLRSRRRTLLEALDFDPRMRSARAVIVGVECLDERTLIASVTFEIATRARQSGVPAYAVTAENHLDAFDARILDLQVILEAHNARTLSAAGRRLADLV